MEVMSAVRTFCTGKRAVVTTIHQPSRAVFELFDKVLLLVQGRVVYFGRPSDAVGYFTSSRLNFVFNAKGGFQNPAEFLLDICRAQVQPRGSMVRLHASDLAGLFEASDERTALISKLKRLNTTSDANSSSQPSSKTGPSSPASYSVGGMLSLWTSNTPPAQPFARSLWSQCRVLIHRSWISKVRDQTDMRSQVVKNLSMGLLYGFVFFNKGDPNGPFYSEGYAEAKVQSLNSLMLQLTVFSAYSNLSAVGYIGASLSRFRREFSSRSYSALAFAASQALSLAPLQFLLILVLVLAMYFPAGMPPSGDYFFFLVLSTFLGFYFSFTLATALTAWAGDIGWAFIFLPVVADVSVTISGYAPQLGDLPTFYHGLANVNVGRWQFEAAMINHWTRYETDDGEGYDENGNGDILDDYGFTGINKFDCLWLILLFSFVALLLLYIGVLPAKSQLRKVTDAEDAKEVLACLGGTTPSQAHSFLADFLASPDSTFPSILPPVAPVAVSQGTLKEKLLVQDASLLVVEEPPITDCKPRLSVQAFSQSNLDSDLVEGCSLVFQNVCSPPENEIRVAKTGAGGNGDNSGNGGNGSGVATPNPMSDDGSISSLSDDVAPEPKHDHAVGRGRTFNNNIIRSTHGGSKGTVFVQGVSGVVLPGEMCAIMGSSGAGKTSLLNILSQRKNPADYSGRVYYNGVRGVMPPFGFVTQEDVHMDVMTVREALEFAGQLRLPEGMPVMEKQRRVERVLKLLLLQGIADSLVGGPYAHGISGGELKRLSIGVELMHFPGLMFLDEPTTGLDSSMSLEVLSALRNLANQHRTIVTTLHQPSQDMFQLFDRVMIMAQSRVVYFGPVQQCTDFYTQSPYQFPFPSSMDPAEFMISAAGSFLPAADGRTVTAGELAAYFASSVQCAALKTNIKTLEQSFSGQSKAMAAAVGGNTVELQSPFHLSLPFQIKVLLERRVLIIRRRWRFYAWKLVRELCLAIFCGTVWFQIGTGSAQHVYEDRLSVINKIVVYVTARNMDPSAVFSDCRFYYRERSLNAYSPVAHWLSIWLPQVPIQVLYGLLFSSIVYPLAGLRAGGQYFMTYMYFAVTADVAAYFLFSCLTALCPSPFAALHYVPLLQILLITMSGFSEYLPNMQVWVKSLTYGVVTRYIFQGLVLNELQDNGNLPESHRYIVKLGFTGLSVGGCAAMMLAFIGVWMVVFFLVLKYVNYERR